VAQPDQRSGEEAPDQLLANPANWRIHPKAQQDALAGALDAVGWVQQVLVNRPSGFVVDGHARVALALSRGEATVPVLSGVAPYEQVMTADVLPEPPRLGFGDRVRRLSDERDGRPAGGAQLSSSSSRSSAT